MRGDLGRDDGRRDGDALDRAIDDALGMVLRDSPRDLRTHVLARLEEPVDDRPSRLLSFFRPALLPVAGAALIVLAVAVSWWQVDDQLRRAGAGRGRAAAGRVDQQRASSTVAERGHASVGMPIPAGEMSKAPSRAPITVQRERRNASDDDRIFASSWLAMDALSRPKGIAADTVIADADESESFLPGAIGGDLGDPIKPIPRPRPIVIPPIVAAPIVATPIVDAPPVSTLATPVSTPSDDNSSRDRTGPGKPGGVLP
jgi:hypothetical protein